MGLEFSRPWDRVCDLSRGPEWATWFVGGKLNLAWNCVHRWARGERADAAAAVWQSEDGQCAVPELPRALGRGDAAGGDAGCARRRGGRPGGVVPADVSRGRDRVARVCAPGRDPGAGLLRLRGAGGRCAAAGLRGQSGDHRRRLAATRARGADEGAGRRGRPRIAVGRARGRLAAARERRADAGRPRRLLGRGRRGLARRARAARGRLRAPVPAHLHVGHDRAAEGRAARPGRLPRLDHARGRVPGRRAARGRDPFRHRHGLDHGPVGGRRRDGARLHGRLRRGRARLARGGSPVGARRAGARVDPRALADAGARVDPARRRAGRAARPVFLARARHDRRAVEPRALPLAVRARGRGTLPDHQLLRWDGGGRVLPLAHAGGADQGVLARRAGAGDGHGRRRLRGAAGARRGRRARLPQAVPRE